MSLLFRQRQPEAERSQLSFAEYTKIIEPWLPWFSHKPTNRETTERTLAGMTRQAFGTSGVAFRVRSGAHAGVQRGHVPLAGFGIEAHVRQCRPWAAGVAVDGRCHR